MGSKKYRVDLEKDTISIRYFVNNYLETDHDCHNLRHCGLKSFGNPFVVGVSNDLAFRNIDFIKEKSVLVVKDCKGDLASYINPILLKRVVKLGQIEDQIQVLEKERVTSLENLETFYQNVITRFELLSKERSLLEKLNGHIFEVLQIFEKEDLIDSLLVPSSKVELVSKPKVYKKIKN